MILLGQKAPGKAGRKAVSWPMYERGFGPELAQGRQQLSCLHVQPSSWGCQAQR